MPSPSRRAVDAATRVIAILVAAGRETAVDQGSRLAAALSFYSIFSLVPLLFLMVAIAGFFLGDSRAVGDLVSEVTDVAGTEVGDTFESLLQRVRSQRTGTLSIGLVLAAFTASGIFQQVQGVLATVFHVPRARRPTGLIGWAVRRTIGVVAALVLALAVFTPIAAVAAIEWLVSRLPDSVDGLVPATSAAIPILSLLLLVAALTLVFQALTPIEIPWKSAIRGGATTALLGLLAASLVGAYLSRAATTSTLGALGGVAILLIFFYLLSVVFVFGAEVTKVYADYLEHGDIAMPSRRHAAAEQSDPATQSNRMENPQESGERRPHAATLAATALIGWYIGRRG